MWIDVVLEVFGACALNGAYVLARAVQQLSRAFLQLHAFAGLERQLPLELAVSSGCTHKLKTKRMFQGVDTIELSLYRKHHSGCIARY